MVLYETDENTHVKTSTQRPFCVTRIEGESSDEGFEKKREWSALR